METITINSKVYEIKNTYFVGAYLFYVTDSVTIFTDGTNHYDIGKYDNVYKVLVMYNELYICVFDKNNLKLVRVKDLEIIFDIPNTTDINKVTDEFVEIIINGKCSDLYNIKTKKRLLNDFSKTYYTSLSSELFLYRSSIFKYIEYFVVSREGIVLYNCHDQYPYYIDGNLIIINDLEESIHIVHNIINNEQRYTVISKAGIILSKPILYKNNVVVCVEDAVKIVDSEINILESIPYKMKGEAIDTKLIDDTLVLTIKDRDIFKEVYIDLITHVIEETIVEEKKKLILNNSESH